VRMERARQTMSRLLVCLLRALPWSPPHCADRTILTYAVVAFHQDRYHTLLRSRKLAISCEGRMWLSYPAGPLSCLSPDLTCAVYLRDTLWSVLDL
jgi:hypothetical protein